MPKQICPHCGGTGEKIDFKEIAGRRKERNLTLREVSGKMGISIQYLSDLEHGRRNWDAQLLNAFNKAVV